MWLFVFNMTLATLYLCLAPRPNKSSKIGPGCAAAPGFADLKTLQNVLLRFFFPTPFLFRVSLLWLLWLYEGGPLLSNTYSLSVSRKEEDRGDKKPWDRLQARATIVFPLMCTEQKPGYILQTHSWKTKARLCDITPPPPTTTTPTTATDLKSALSWTTQVSHFWKTVPFRSSRHLIKAKSAAEGHHGTADRFGL